MTEPAEPTVEGWCPGALELEDTLYGYWAPSDLDDLMIEVAATPPQVPVPAADLLKASSASLSAAVREFADVGGDPDVVLDEGVYSPAAGPLTEWFDTYFEAGADEWLEGNNTFLEFVADNCDPEQPADPVEVDLPDSLDLGPSICDAMDQGAVEDWLGASVEILDLADLLEEYDLENENGEYSCLMKQADGDDQAPAVVLQVTADQEQADVLKGLEDKAFVVQTECEVLDDVDTLHVNHCVGGLGGPDTSVYNIWTFVDGASVLCGAGKPDVTLDSALAICLPFMNNLG